MVLGSIRPSRMSRPYVRHTLCLRYIDKDIGQTCIVVFCFVLLQCQRRAQCPNYRPVHHTIQHIVQLFPGVNFVKQEWQGCVHMSEKLCSYVMFKSVLVRESYLSCVQTCKYRISLTRFRVLVRMTC
jgi:hypothetical protein